MSSTLTSSPGSPRPLSQGWWRGCVAWGFCIVNTRYWRSDILPIPAWSRFLYTWWVLIYEVLGYIKTVLNSFPLNYQASSHFIYIVIGSVSFVLQRHIHTRPFLHLTATRVNKQSIRDPHQSWYKVIHDQPYITRSRIARTLLVNKDQFYLGFPTQITWHYLCFNCHRSLKQIHWQASRTR